METRDSLKYEIDKIQEEYLAILYEIIRAFVKPSPVSVPQNDWNLWVEKMYGCLSDDKIQKVS